MVTVLDAVDALVARPRRTVEQVLADARSVLVRLSPAEAFAAQQNGAVLVDIRPDVNQQAEGVIPGSLVIHRNVLEWRLDPSSDACLPMASYDLQVVVVCNEGYTSSLAAASLVDVGLHRATDLVGGFRAWKAAGLPVSPSGEDCDRASATVGHPADHHPAPDAAGRRAGGRAPHRRGRGVLARRRTGPRAAGRDVE